MKKIPKFAEGAWVVAVILISLAVALITKSGFGVSSIVAPAYVIHLKLSETFAWYTFGKSEYILQGVLLAVMCLIIKKFRFRYLLSFVTSVIYGVALDGWLLLLGSDIPGELYMGCILFGAGLLLTSFSVALFFRTYLPLQVYELLVNEISGSKKLEKSKFKLCYDLFSLVLAVTLTLIFNKSLRGIGIGTVLCAILNAPLIRFFGGIFDRIADFSPAFPRIKEKLTK